MKPILFTLSMIMFGLALRSTKRKWLRKLGIFLCMAASGLVVFAITESILAGIIVAFIWLAIPLIELVFVVKKLEIPIANKLREEKLRCCDYFPESEEIHDHLEENSFTPLTQCGWNFGNSYEHYSYLWNEQRQCLAAVCHRVEPCTTFTYVKLISSIDKDKQWVTTNFPFSNCLFFSPDITYNHITCCQKSCPKNLLYAHDLLLHNNKVHVDSLMPIKSEEVMEFAEKSMQFQVNYNIKKGVLNKISETHYSYSFKGIFFMWIQTLKDFFRLC